ncbi:MAG TPA: T9SS type A sorting domain-containing protein [Hanamia sp.]|nr:T9SS type A sorting domain-containing protein [Hanamia sp.]
MPFFQKKTFKNIPSKKYFTVTIFLFATINCFSQSRKYTSVYSENINGGCTIFGNTLMNIVDSLGHPDLVKMNDNAADGNSIYGNDGEDMEYVDVDGNRGAASFTKNSSSADLILPAGTNSIKLARIYWGGRIADSEFNLSTSTNRTIKIRKGISGEYSVIPALGIDTLTIINGFTQYQAYADITDFIKANGAGTYEAGSIPLSTGAIADGGNHGGWSIVVVYENQTLPFNSIRVYDGFEVVYNGGNDTTSTITLTGLNVPSTPLQSSDARMGVVVWEGDANLPGDFLTINGYLFYNATNPPFNLWNGTITGNGVHVTTKNPDYTNQMGIDIDQFDVGTGYGIAPNATSVTLLFGTTADKYFPGVFTFTVKMKDTGPLPVTLSSFTATLSNNNVVNLNWSTSIEINCSTFVVQRSYDAIHFTDFETVAGNGTTNLFHSYSGTDNAYSFENGIVYYQLKQIDFDGKENFSKIISVKVKSANKIIISPNPFNNFINVNFQSDKRKPLSVKLYNIDGKEIFSKQIYINAGDNYFRIDNLSNLPAGNYLLQLISDGKKVIQKIVKN